MRLSPRLPRPRWWAATALAAVLTAGLVTLPWNSDDAPTAQAQEDPPAETDGVAPTEAEALAEAQVAGEPVEVANLRSEYRDVFANPDGTFTATDYVVPVRTMVDGEWTDIDPTLEVAEDGSVRPRASTVPVVFSGGGDEPLVTAAKNGRTLTLDWAGELPAPSLDGDTATYAEVLPGVDLRVRALADGFTHVLVVKNAEAAANPALSSIEWPVTVDGAAIQATAAGGLEVVDADTEDVWLAAGSPLMWDSSGMVEAAAANEGVAPSDTIAADGAGDTAVTSGEQAEVGVRVESGAVVLEPDTELLTGAETVYPVYIDPVYKDEYRSEYAMVASEFPSQSYYKNWTNEGAGYCGAWANCEKKRLFYSVSSSFYAGKDILSATFGVTLENNYYHENKAHYADLYLMHSGISSSTDWNNQPSGTKIDSQNTPEPSIDSCSYSTAHATEWDVENEVQNAADDGDSTLTFGIRNANESDVTHWMRFCNNGHLRVKYNTRPDQPDTGLMRSSPGSSCQYSFYNDSYVNELPTLYATATDPDHRDVNEWGSGDGSRVSEEVRMRFRLVWGPNDAYSWMSDWSSYDDSGSEFELDLATVPDLPVIPEGESIGWIAQASDGELLSDWSWTGPAPQARCRFILDSTAPEAPTVTSTDFPAATETIPLMVGEIGTLTLSTTEDDIVAYKVDFLQDSEAVKQIDLDTAGSDAVVEYLPGKAGRHVMDVWALDAAGNSASDSYSFRVSAAGPASVWALDEAAGGTEAADAVGDNPGTPASGVTFGADGPGAATAASFDGTSAAYIDTGVYDIAPTGEGASIAAWARVDDLSRDGVVASIDGGIGEAGMILGYRSTSATSGVWVLSMPDMAMSAFTAWEVTGGAVTATNQDEWVHLAGTWNDFTGQMTLYINGEAVDSAQRQTTWWGDGTVQIGRANVGGFWDDHFTGSIAGVHVFDRVLTADEAEVLGWNDAVRAGYWQFNTVGDAGSPEATGGPAAVLSGGAGIYVPTDPDFDAPALVGEGHLELDGVDGCASVAAQIVDTSRSFSLTARVRLDTASPANSMTVLSIPGTNASAIEVGYDAATGLWELRLADSDATGATITSVANTKVAASDESQSIAVVYDSITGQARLYVNGVASDPLADPFLTSWAASGGLEIGRGFTGGSFGSYFAGAVDDVRAYSGVLHPMVITELHHSGTTERPEL